MAQRHDKLDHNYPLFITTNVKRRYPIFEQKSFAELLYKNILKTAKMKNFKIYNFVIMLEHVHILGKQLGDYTVSEFLNSFKSFFAFQLREKFKINEPVWQKRFYCLEVPEEGFEKVFNYIKNNPLKANFPKKFTQKPYYYKNPSLVNF